MDIIKSGGYKISALDIERSLLSHDDVHGSCRCWFTRRYVWSENSCCCSTEGRIQLDSTRFESVVQRQNAKVSGELLVIICLSI